MHISSHDQVLGNAVLLKLSHRTVLYGLAVSHVCYKFFWVGRIVLEDGKGRQASERKKFFRQQPGFPCSIKKKRLKMAKSSMLVHYLFQRREGDGEEKLSFKSR